MRKELAQGAVLISSLGYTVAYNTLDNVKSPTSGLYADVKQDVAGIGGDVNYVRTSAEARTYYEVLPDVVGVLKVQGGNISAWGGKDLRMLDHFFMGPNLVRGFAAGRLRPARPDAGHDQRRARRLDVLGRERGSADAAVLPAQGSRHQGSRFSPTPATCGAIRGRRLGM